MPPRIPTPRSPHYTSLFTTSSTSTSTFSQCLIRTRCLRQPLPSARSFSSTPSQSTRLRQTMNRWLAGAGAGMRNPRPGYTNYLTDYDREGHHKHDTDRATKLNAGEGNREKDSSLPFPQNKSFKSEPVLDEKLREEVWRRVVEEGKTVRVVSAELGVDMRRVGAVVRLKTIEKDWTKKGLPLATPYARLLLSILPTTTYTPPSSANALPPLPHESINDLPSHTLASPQIFHPTSESHHFTRESAARIFSSPTSRSPLLPADARIPHPDLIVSEKDRLAGLSDDERQERQKAREDEEAARLAIRDQSKRERQERNVKIVEPEGARWLWKFQEVSVFQAGKDGRGSQGGAARYGLPREDRKKGVVKIPTRV